MANHICLESTTLFPAVYFRYRKVTQVTRVTEWHNINGGHVSQKGGLAYNHMKSAEDPDQSLHFRSPIMVFARGFSCIIYMRGYPDQPVHFRSLIRILPEVCVLTMFLHVTL